MTTRHINGINASRRAAQAVAESARERHQRLAEEAAAVQRAREADDANFEIARRASEQEHNDRLAVLGEEIEQVSYVANGNAGQAQPAPDAAADQPDDEPPAQPEVPVVDEPEPPAQTAVLEPAPAEPQEALGLPPAQPVDVQYRWYDPRGWTTALRVVAFLLGIILAFIGLLIGLNTVGWLNDGWTFVEWLRVVLTWVLGIVWVLGITAIGFFAGVSLGYLIWYLIVGRRENRGVEPAPAVPAPPAAP